MKKKTKQLAKANSFPIVGIGASAGGLNAYTRLLKVLAADTGMAFVLIQHLDPTHVSLLPELITRTTAMPVIEASDGMRIECNHVYIMPPTHSLALLHGVLHLIQRPEGRGKYLPIDGFLTSLAQDQQNNSIGVILSGTASDGTLGLQAIKATDGITFAQREDTAEFSDMPHNAIASGYVDFILTPEEIAKKLAQIAQHPYLKHPFPNVEQETAPKEEGLNKIFIMLRARTGVDFTYYKHNTILRRIKRRMTLHQLDRITDYVKFLQSNANEIDALFNDILINVTSFFRDPETFVALKQEVFPLLMKLNFNQPTLRIWIPACATGEEAYSIAMALFEFLDDEVDKIPIQIFASDINKQAIDKARQGIYPPSIEEVVGPERLKRFFIKITTGYQICQAIRNVCVFAVQNVIQDPPFSRLNLICCRNLLIYLGTVLQKKVLHTFYYALRPNCFLVLGSSESIGSEAELFSSMDKKYKIYIRKANVNQPDTEFMQQVYTKQHFFTPRPNHLPAPPAIIVQKAAEDIILKEYGPPGVIIDQNMHILHFCGQTGPYIEPSAGGASLSLLKMVRQELVLDLRTLINHAIKENCSARKEGVRIAYDGNYKNLNLQITPLPSSETIAPSYLVLFETGADKPTQQGKPQPAIDSKDAKDLRIKELEDIAIAEREYMQSIIEEHEETNEELQAANEEIQSANEELQSTNEELETTKEELQSANEELTTIIEEHDNRNRELNIVNHDLSNLLASIDIAIVILHSDLAIRRFTPTAKILLNLIDADIGRPITNIRPNVTILELERKIQQVIETSTTKSLEVQDHNGHWYLLRIHPYQKNNHYIDGVVLVFLDIDSVKNFEQLRLELQSEKRLSTVVRDSNDAVSVQDFAHHILAWNQRATQMYGYSEEEALQLDARKLTPDDANEQIQLIFERLQQGIKVPPCKMMRRAQDGRLLKVWMTASALVKETGEAYAVAITEREIA